MSVTVKYGGRSLATSEGTIADVKSALVEPTGLAVNEMKLLHAGKVISDEAVIPAGAKCMLMRQPAATGKRATVIVNVREIVSGRVAYRRSVDPTMPHDDLVSFMTKVLRLPPCDAHTEVRVFLPHARLLMRPDLTLSDYTLPAASSPLELYAVPCPAGLASGEAAATAAANAAKVAHEQAERRMDELAAHTAASIATAADAGDPDAISMMNQMIVDGEMGCVTPLLPPSLADVTAAAKHGAGASRAATADRCGGDSEEAASADEEAPALRIPTTTSSSPARPPPRHPASLVPAKLRTGLMPPVDEAPMRLVELPASLLLEVEAMEASLAPPSAAEWEAIAAAEEERLEARCADLVCSLAPSVAALPSSPMRRPTQGARVRPEGSSGFGSGLSAGFLTERRPKPKARRASAGQAHAPPVDEQSSSSLTSSVCSICTTAEESAAESTEETVAAPLTEQPPSKLHKPKGAACKSCGTRLPLTAAASACKCGHVFCALHMHDHKCTHDYRAPARQKLAEDNPKLEGPKLERM